MIRMANGNRNDPAQCKVTVYVCCQVNVGPNSDRMAERGHQCHGAPVRDGLCLRHLGDRIRLLRGAA
jgi:hypothetical protein